MEGKHLKDMNEAEYKEYYFKSKYWLSLSKLFHLGKFLHIFQFQFSKEPLGWRVRRRLNPYNPLTYIALLVTLVVAITGQFFMACMEIFTDLKRVFKYE